MAQYGPIPKRDDERIRRNKPDQPTLKIIPGENLKVEAPLFILDNPNPLVIDYYLAMQKSPQAQYFQQTDWIHAQAVLTLLNEQLNARQKNGQIIAVIMSELGKLMTTEGERRRLRIEIEAANAENAKESSQDYLKRVLEL